MRGRMVWVVLAAAVVLVVVGAGVLLFSPASFGWFAHSPLASTMSFDFTGGVYPLTTQRAGGLAAFGAGLLLIAGVAGWVIGRRSGVRDRARGDR